MLYKKDGIIGMEVLKSVSHDLEHLGLLRDEPGNRALDT